MRLEPITGNLALLVLLASCKDAGREPYVRLREPAPAALQEATRGPTLVSFWGSWCPPCVAETEALAALAANPPAGLEVVVVAVQEDPAAARKAFPGVRVIADPAGALAKSVRAGEMPAAFLAVGGRLVARFDGPRAWDDGPARRTLERLVAAGP